MKKIKFLTVSAAFLAATTAAMADGMSFEPVDVNYSPIPAAETKSLNATKNSFVLPEASGEKFQNAILQLDAVQVELRNSYIQQKEKYQQVDTQYKAVKAERKELSRAVRTLEKKINNIEKTKANIRKTMQ